MKKILTMLLPLALAAGLAFGQDAAPPVKYGQNVGDTAKPMMLKGFDGAEFNTGKLEKKTVFVFVNSVCSMCAREMKEIDQFSDKLTEKADVVIVAVDMNLDRVQQKYQAYTKKFKALHDPDFTFGEAVGLYSTPSTLVLDKSGKIVYKSSGYQPEILKDVAATL